MAVKFKVYGDRSRFRASRIATACREAGVVPHVAFPHGRYDIVKLAGGEGWLFVRRRRVGGYGKEVDWSTNPDLFSRSLKRNATPVLRRWLGNVGAPYYEVEYAMQ